MWQEIPQDPVCVFDADNAALPDKLVGLSQ